MHFPILLFIKVSHRGSTVLGLLVVVSFDSARASQDAREVEKGRPAAIEGCVVNAAKCCVRRTCLVITVILRACILYDIVVVVGRELALLLSRLESVSTIRPAEIRLTPLSASITLIVAGDPCFQDSGIVLIMGFLCWRKHWQCIDELQSCSPTWISHLRPHSVLYSTALNQLKIKYLRRK